MIDWIERCRQHLAAQKPKKPDLKVVLKDGKVVPITKAKTPIPKKPKY